MVGVLSVALALRLRAAGLRWDPTPGDRFVLPNRGMDDEAFLISDMTVDVYDRPTGRVIRFNGTVEWALDSVVLDDALWLPSEEQLRERLGGTFTALHRDGANYRIELDVSGRRFQAVDPEPAHAYARALLHLMTGESATD
jgi:hypothetical protein